MRTTLPSVLALLLSALGLAGCGTKPIPQVAVKGTTIMIPVPDGFRAGFGRALNETLQYGDVVLTDNSVGESPLDDFQRGELLFALRAGPTTASPRITYLPVRYITRVHLDESSDAALPSQEGEPYINVGTQVQTGQIVAFVDIPLAEQLVPERYYVFVERWRRPSSGSPTFVQLTPTTINYNYLSWPWIGWANFSPDQGIPLRIVDQDPGEGDFVQELFHDPFGGWDKWSGGYNFLDHTEDLEHLVPNLKLRIRIGDPGTLTFPAAWEMTLAYPAGKIEVTGATLGRIHRSGGLVNVSTTGSPSACGAPGTARISMIDPDRYSPWVDVVYRLRDPTCGRATVNDFAPVPGSTKAYDVDGNLIEDLPAFLDPDYDF